MTDSDRFITHRVECARCCVTGDAADMTAHGADWYCVDHAPADDTDHYRTVAAAASHHGSWSSSWFRHPGRANQ